MLFAGTTVCIAMLGLIALGVSFFYGMAIGTAIAVSLTMLASLTLLPALLSLLGLKVLPRKQRRDGARRRVRRRRTPTGFWARWSDLVARRKWRYAADRRGASSSRSPIPFCLDAARATPTRATTAPARPPARATT